MGSSDQIMKGDTLLVLLSLGCCLLHLASAANTTEQDERGSRQMGVFTVVKFPNDICSGSNSLNGTCYTSSECTAKGGNAQGTCASSFGVCCVFSLSCGATSSENNTYAIMSSYSTTTDPNPCTYTFCRSSADICKLRIDMDTMVISDPVTYSSASLTPTASALLTHELEVGACTTDRMTVSNPDGGPLPTICGYNTGQHMWVDASSKCNTINIQLDTGTSTTRKWQFTVKQYACGSLNAPQEDCLQYYTASSGTFASFNFDTSSTTVSTSSTHLQSQYYNICFRRTRSKCSVCFSPQIVGAAAAVTSFGISASGAAAAFSSAVDTLCEMSAAITQGPALSDWVSVVNLQPSTGTTGTVGRQKICGQLFNAAPATTITAATACSWSTPFRWQVHLADGEIFTTELASAIAAIAQENVATPALIAGAGNGYTGFYMAFWQNSC